VSGIAICDLQRIARKRAPTLDPLSSPSTLYSLEGPCPLAPCPLLQPSARFVSLVFFVVKSARSVSESSTLTLTLKLARSALRRTRRSALQQSLNFCDADADQVAQASCLPLRLEAESHVAAASSRPSDSGSPISAATWVVIFTIDLGSLASSRFCAGPPPLAFGVWLLEFGPLRRTRRSALQQSLKRRSRGPSLKPQLYSLN
jgi:hypothetical protein